MTKDTPIKGDDPGLSMKSVNTFMTRGSRDHIDNLPDSNRSKSVREYASVLLLAHHSGDQRVEPEIKRIIEATGPKFRRTGAVHWEKAIVWIPNGMVSSIQRAFHGKITESEFLRAAVILATRPEDLREIFQKA